MNESAVSLYANTTHISLSEIIQDGGAWWRIRANIVPRKLENLRELSFKLLGNGARRSRQDTEW